jgi:hypothetical protein
MAHFAEIDETNIVLRVLVVDDAEEHRGQEFLAKELGLGGTWIQCSYNTRGGVHKYGGTPLRKNYPGPGFIYDPVRNAFLPPENSKQFSSWVLDEEKCSYVAPSPKPDDGNAYRWNEDTLSWDSVDPAEIERLTKVAEGLLPPQA